MPNIENMDFSENSPEVNMSLLKLQAMHNLGQLSAKDYDDFVLQLKNTPDKIEVIDKIDDLEDKWFNPFCGEYITEILHLAESKSEQYFPEDYDFFLSLDLDHYKSVISVPSRSFSTKDEDLLLVQIKNNAEFTPQKAEKILELSEKLPKAYYNRSADNPQGYQIANTCISISNTKGLDKAALKLLSNNPSIIVSYLGKHVLQRSGISEYIKPEDLIKSINKMENIEKGVNPEWSDTAKALYIFKTLYKTCTYDHNGGNSVHSVFLKNKSMCEGFATAYQEMMMRQNIPCRICTSETGGHLFNEIKLNNKWAPIDVSDAALCYNRDGWSEAQVEDYAFAGKSFISELPEHRKNHHRSGGGRFVKDHTSDEINYLTSEERAKAVDEILQNPAKQEINAAVKMSMMSKYYRK